MTMGGGHPGMHARLMDASAGRAVTPELTQHVETAEEALSAASEFVSLGSPFVRVELMKR